MSDNRDQLESVPNPRYDRIEDLETRVQDLERQLKEKDATIKWLKDHDNEWCVFYHQVKEKDKEIKRLRDALEKIASGVYQTGSFNILIPKPLIRIAKEALKGEKE